MYTYSLTNNRQLTTNNLPAGRQAYKQIREARLSPSLNFIILTPCVWRPKTGISLRSTRTTWLFLEIAITSLSSSVTTCEVITCPVFDVTFEVKIPEPPLPCTLYSDSSVRLP